MSLKFSDLKVLKTKKLKNFDRLPIFFVIFRSSLRLKKCFSVENFAISILIIIDCFDAFNFFSHLGANQSKIVNNFASLRGSLIHTSHSLGIARALIAFNCFRLSIKDFFISKNQDHFFVQKLGKVFQEYEYA